MRGCRTYKTKDSSIIQTNNETLPVLLKNLSEVNELEIIKNGIFSHKR